jgi:hypothetical protein
MRRLWLTVALALAASLGIAIGSTGCTDEQEATRVLRVSGFRDVVFTGWGFGCHRDDVSATGFVGTLSGERVEGVVCCGVSGCGGSCTVRLK